jgi:ribosome maturation factor RimP
LDTVWKLRTRGGKPGLELWDVNTVRKRAGLFCASISTSGGVGIEDCERFSRALDPVLDEADPIPDSYVFEVSSAGAERALKRPTDFARFMGETVEVKLYKGLDGRKIFVGTLDDYDSGAVTIRTAQGLQRFEKEQIAQVRLRIV